MFGIILFRVKEERIRFCAGKRKRTFFEIFIRESVTKMYLWNQLNIFSLIPYVFTLTRHLFLNIILSLTLWFRFLIYLIYNNLSFPVIFIPIKKRQFLRSKSDPNETRKENNPISGSLIHYPCIKKRKLTKYTGSVSASNVSLIIRNQSRTRSSRYPQCSLFQLLLSFHFGHVRRFA